MIDTAFHFILKFLNREFELSFGAERDMVVSGNLVNPDGTLGSGFDNKVVVSLINLEQETSIKNGREVYSIDGKYGKSAPPIFMNMYLLFAANFDSGNYMEGLKMISKVISIFQVNGFFTRQAYPDMGAGLDKLTFEIINLSANDLSHVWGGLGTKYLPSMVYKVRMIAFDGEEVIKEVPGIGKMQGDVK